MPMFMLSKKEAEPNHWSQLGIVVQTSIETAAAQLNLKILCSVAPPDSAIQYASLEGGYCLEEYPRIFGTIAELEASEKIAE